MSSNAHIFLLHTTFELLLSCVLLCVTGAKLLWAPKFASNDFVPLIWKLYHTSQRVNVRRVRSSHTLFPPKFVKGLFAVANVESSSLNA